MRRQYREKYYVCGDYLEAHIFPVYRKSISRRKKSKPSRECQQKLNDISAENQCIRIVHANFSYKDMKIDLTYDNAHVPISDEKAAKELENFLRRLKRYRNKLGLPELKYISVTEKGKRTGRYHHHLIINGGLTPQEIIAIWGRGYVRTDAL